MDNFRYALVSSAKNEGKYIDTTIKAVISQSIQPVKWVIASNGSTDNTDEIIKNYAERYDFIEYIRVEATPERSFANKVYAIRECLKLVEPLDYDFLGNLDADAYFDPEYYENLLKEFHKNPHLGLCGGQIIEEYYGRKKAMITRHDLSVGGITQIFRRNVWEAIGGYTPQTMGGEDYIARCMVKRLGWEVRTFPHCRIYHLRPINTEGRDLIRARFMQGLRDYVLGYHPLYEFFKCLYHFSEYPYFLGAASWWAGYVWGKLRRYKHTIPDDLIRDFRRDQMRSLRNIMPDSRDSVKY